MAVNQAYPVLDGIAPSWADVACNFSIPGAALLKMEDFKSIDSGTTLEVGEQRGASGGRVLKRTSGATKHEASAVLYYTGFQKLQRALMASGQVRGNQIVVGCVHFGINIQMTPFGSTEIYEIRIKGCRYMGRKIAAAEGTDAQLVDVNLNPIEVVDIVDGKEIVLA